jgi:hypothetical protein
MSGEGRTARLWVRGFLRLLQILGAFAGVLAILPMRPRFLPATAANPMTPF